MNEIYIYLVVGMIMQLIIWIYFYKITEENLISKIEEKRKEEIENEEIRKRIEKRIREIEEKKNKKED